MRIATRFKLVLMAAFAVSAIAASSASAIPVFLSHPLGLLLAGVDNVQVFKFAIGTVECRAVKLSPPDSTVALQALVILVQIQYETCEIPPLGPVTVDPFRYKITAHGLVSVDTDAFILGPLGCKIEVSRVLNHDLEKLKFDNSGNAILVLANVSEIWSSGVGGAGFCEYALENKGTYQGTIHLTVEGGKLKWDA